MSKYLLNGSLRIMTFGVHWLQKIHKEKPLSLYILVVALDLKERTFQISVDFSFKYLGNIS